MSVCCSSSCFCINSPCVFQNTFPGESHTSPGESFNSQFDWMHHFTQAILTQQLSSQLLPTTSSLRHLPEMFCVIRSTYKWQNQNEIVKWTVYLWIFSDKNVVLVYKVTSNYAFHTYQNIYLKLKDTANPNFSPVWLADKSLLMTSFLLVNIEGKLYKTYKSTMGTVRKSSVIGHFTDMGISLMTDLWRGSLRQ